MNDQVTVANVIPVGTIGSAPAGPQAPIGVIPDLKCTLPPDNTFWYIILAYCAIVLFGMVIASYMSKSQQNEYAPSYDSYPN